MFRKILKALIAIFFVPVVISSTKAFFQSLRHLDFVNVNLLWLVSGFFTYPIFHIIFLKPMYIYAWGHEIVHVLSIWLCGGKVTSFQISQEGGTVAATKSNLFIRLSPYFVPIHAIFLFLLYWILSRFYNMSKFSNEFTFLIGFAISFHLIMTVEVMKKRQPDILKTGYLFSILLIYVANISVALLVLSFIVKDISFVAFIKKTFVYSKSIYSHIFSRWLT
ncbi:MAG: hypothetical protein JSV93_06030 [Candidatus Omnitrophota bacterium]|nr:MAG: hypothetical protein JSV93_06030 [Candidatus Omnitrophota bacterium]